MNAPTARAHYFIVDGVKMRCFASYQRHNAFIEISLGEGDKPSMAVTVPVYWYDHGREIIRTSGRVIKKVLEG